MGDSRSNCTRRRAAGPSLGAPPGDSACRRSAGHRGVAFPAPRRTPALVVIWQSCALAIMAPGAPSQARELGQSIWLAYWDRGLIESGRIAQLIAEAGAQRLAARPRA
ncbi:hypothetical protein SBBP2_2750001 [Burkholderiales bacterium]|nr:hypothetical protein SBBP2_2750001 [Burkholderiales bacterium]